MAGIKKSAVVAFLELLRSVQAGEDVLLLRSGDCFANEAVQNYNDRLHEMEEDEVSPMYLAYRAFTDKLAEKFAVVDAGLPDVVMPDKELSKTLADILFAVTGKVLDNSTTWN